MYSAVDVLISTYKSHTEHDLSCLPAFVVPSSFQFDSLWYKSASTATTDARECRGRRCEPRARGEAHFDVSKSVELLRNANQMIIASRNERVPDESELKIDRTLSIQQASAHEILIRAHFPFEWIAIGSMNCYRPKQNGWNSNAFLGFFTNFTIYSNASNP